MTARILILFCVCTLCFGFISCKKLGEEAQLKGQLQQEKIKALDSIAAAYGKLVQVTTGSTYQNWAQLWFEKPDKTIVVVALNYITGEIAGQVLVIPRK